MADIELLQYGGLRRGTTLSPPCGKVHMALRLKGQRYITVNLTSPFEVRRHNPRGRVPILRLDGETIADSSDILDALDRRFPEPALLPDDPLQSARARVLEDWADEVLYFQLVFLRWVPDAAFARMRAPLAKLPPPLRWIAPTLARREARRRLRGQGTGLKDEATVRGELAGCLMALEALLAGREFLVDERVSRADLSVCAVIDQLRVKEITPEAAAEVEAHPAIVAWCERVHAVAPPAI